MPSDHGLSVSRSVEPESGASQNADDDAASVARMSRALSTLTTSQREVLVLSYFERLTQPQIAARLGMPLATVRVDVASALIRLATAIEGKAAPARRRPGAHYA